MERLLQTETLFLNFQETKIKIGLDRRDYNIVHHE